MVRIPLPPPTSLRPEKEKFRLIRPLNLAEIAAASTISPKTKLEKLSSQV